MANTVVKIKRTSTAGKVPNTVNLPNAGELALNMTDGILYSTNGSNIFEIGANNTTTRVSNSISVGANLVINTSTFFVGNSTVNTTITSSQITNDIAQLDVAVYVGDNVDITTTGLTIGNSSINTAINSSSLSTRGIIANGTLGTDGQVLHSNGTTTYWNTISASGNAKITVSNSAPASPSNNDLWWDDSQGTLFVRYGDGDSAQWVESHQSGIVYTSPAVPPLYIQSTQPTVSSGNKYMWVQTGLGTGGEDFTIWIEDGA